MIFRNREDGGNKLAPLLSKYQGDKNAVIIGLPRGGVVTAYALASKLQLPLDVTCPRKIGAPFNSELAIGAITESGEAVLNARLIDEFSISEKYIETEMEKEKAVAQRRLEIFRKGKPPRNFDGKTVILVDDGLATGYTMKAAIKSMRAAGVGKIVVAIPVSPPDTLKVIKQEADEVYCLDAPWYFQAVGQFYDEFAQTSDEEVIEILKIS